MNGLAGNIPPTPGDRIRIARLRAGLTSADAAAFCDSEQMQWSNWENNKTRPSFAKLKLICETLDCTADWILGLSPTIKHGWVGDLPTGKRVKRKKASKNGGKAR